MSNRSPETHPTWHTRLMRLARAYLLSLFCFSWGVATIKYEVFPHALIEGPLRDLGDWLRGPAEGKKLSFLQKFRAEFERELPHQGDAPIGQTIAESLKPVRDPQELLKDAKIRLKYTSQRSDGYYLIYLIPFARDAMFGAAVISADGELKRLIKRPRLNSPRRVLGQGGVTDQGHLIFNSYQHLYVTDLCGQVALKRDRGRGQFFGQGVGRGFHHKASGADGVIWTWYANELRAYRLRDQKFIKQHTLLDLVAANPELPVFEPRLLKSSFHGTFGEWRYDTLKSKKIKRKKLKLADISLPDPFHQNDVDVLPRALADRFPDFAAGDLLLSFRSINLIVVIDPKTLKVKWYHSGVFSRQHDPDWGESGEIILYDNRSHYTSSRIIAIDPKTKSVRTLVDGSKWNFYQFAQGNQHVDAEGRVFFTNNSEAVQLNRGEIDFYIQYETLKGKPLDVGTVRFIDEETYARWTTCDGDAEAR